MPRFLRTPNTRRAVAARLEQLQRDGATRSDDATAPPRTPVRWLLFAGCLIAVLGTGWVVRSQLVAPPRSLTVRRLADGTPVRLVAVTRAAEQSYQYRPADHPLRRLASRFGRTLGWPAVQSAAAVPDDAVTLWMLVDKPLQLQLDRLEFSTPDGAVYTTSPPQSAVVGGQVNWGRGTLVWAALTNFDRSAAQVAAAVPLGPRGEAARFTVEGPAQQPAEWDLSSDYPLTAGNKDAVLRLQQLRRPQAEAIGLSLDGSPPPEPLDAMLLADLDVIEPGGITEDGLWLIEVTTAETRSGERLAVVRQTAGLTWLTRGRTAAGIDALRLKVEAEKQVRGVGVVVFRNLELPAVKESVNWARSSDAPFPGAQFIAQTCERPTADQAVITIDARAPSGTEFASLTYADGLDQAGHKLRNLPGTSLPADESRTSAAGNSWRWTFEARLFPETATIALAFRVTFKRIAKRATATFLGPVQAPLASDQMAACGLVLEPFNKPNEAAVRVRVAEILPESGAAESSLRPGDEILQVDGLPPGLWGRAVSRHRPGEALEVKFRRAGQVYQGRVKLDQYAGG